MITVESAQQKFAGAKAISSDQYFGRDKEDPYVSVMKVFHQPIPYVTCPTDTQCQYDQI